MPFAKGHDKGGGRKHGAINKATREIKDLARALLEDKTYQKNLKARLHRGDCPQIESLLYHYAYGKPAETMKLYGHLTLEQLVMGEKPAAYQEPT